jgi:acyl carrier protein
MAGLTEDTFDIGHPKYAAKYERSVDAIARYVQEQYKSGADVALAM